MTQVFLSYTRAQSGPAAEALSQALRVAGLDVFKDNKEIRAGDRWLEKLDAALAECDLFIVSGLERWTLTEAPTALTRHVDGDRRSTRSHATSNSGATSTPAGPRPRLLPVLMTRALGPPARRRAGRTAVPLLPGHDHPQDKPDFHHRGGFS